RDTPGIQGLAARTDYTWRIIELSQRDIVVAKVPAGGQSDAGNLAEIGIVSERKLEPCRESEAVHFLDRAELAEKASAGGGESGAETDIVLGAGGVGLRDAIRIANGPWARSAKRYHGAFESVAVRIDLVSVGAGDAVTGSLLVSIFEEHDVTRCRRVEF